LSVTKSEEAHFSINVAANFSTELASAASGFVALYTKLTSGCQPAPDDTTNQRSAPPPKSNRGIETALN
jgi:hypothetical protein